MLNKKVKALLFIFMILFCAAAASAESIDDNSQSVDIVDVKSNDYIATIDETDVGNFSSLNEKINGASGTVQLEQDYRYDNGTDHDYINGISISRDLTIDGQGHTVDGNNMARIFKVADTVSLTLKNIKLINGTASEHGGAIYGGYNNNITIINSTFSNNNVFTNNKVNSYGGAIYIKGNVTVINSTFSGNNAVNNNDNADDYGYGRGGAIYCDILYITNSTFVKNHATTAGGALHGDHINISNSTFQDNSVDYEMSSVGGAVYCGYRLNITSSIFENNDALIGGAIVLDGGNDYTEYSAYVSNSTFINNTGYEGGAIFSLVTINITESCFIGNSAIEGGAVYAVGNANITDSVFAGNNATYGGALCAFGKISITNSQFNNNNATYGGAIYYTDMKSFINLYIEYLRQQDPEDYKELEEYLKTQNMTVEEYLMDMYKQSYPWFNDTSKNIIIVRDSSFSENHGKFGDDIYTIHNTTLLNNSYTKGSYANIYANNTIVKCTVVSVLDNATYYVTTGKVFKVNATVLADGASINGYNLTITDGTNNYSAEYKGYGVYEITGDILADFEIRHYSAILNSQTDSNRYAVNNGTVIVNDKRDLEIEVELNPAVAGGNITGNITLRDENGEIANVTGEVTIEINGKNYTVNVTEGRGTFNIEDEFGPGNYTMNVTFPGNEDYNPAETSKDFTIEDNQIILEVHDLTKYYGNSSKLIILLTDSHGNPLVNQEVTITINGVKYTRMTDSEGKIQMSINLIPGIYETEVSYGNITKNVTVTVLTTIEAEDMVKYFRNGSQYYAKFYNVDGTPLANTNVTFNIHGVFYTRTTDENGIAKLNINLNPGEYIITAYNPVNNESKANVITVLSTIFGENVIKFYRNGTQYYAYVLDENGNPLANANVTFNIHRVFYNRTTDEKGIVKLNINLNPGEYIITAWNLWNGEATSNNITVYNVVVSEDLEMTTTERKSFKVTILGEQGEPLANAEVTFNIHGVFYHKTTDANGQVSLDINLIAGKYIITTYYNEYAVSNTIVVK